jgi:hypothetical protein
MGEKDPMNAAPCAPVAGAPLRGRCHVHRGRKKRAGKPALPDHGEID